MTEFLPRASAPAVDSSGRFTRETYDALRRTIAALNDADAALSERQRETLAILKALGADDVESLEALGPLLDGKQDASEVLDAVAAIIGTGIVAYKPGAVIGRSIAPVAGETTVSNGGGLAGNPTVGLADLANSGAGSLLAITRDAKGRVSGTKAATITGTAGRVTVANGDASAGLPTVDLATVADGGGGALLRIVRDAWGRITGTSTPTTTDLAEGSNLYHTTARARAAAVADTITDGVLDVAPSQNAVFDALALKSAIPNGYIDGLQMQWVSATALTVSSGAAYIEASGNIVSAPSDIAKTGLSLTASTWYHVYLYLNAGTPDIEIVTTAPVVYSGTARSKTGDTSRRYVGSIKTDASGNIYNFVATQGGAVSYNEVASSAPFRLIVNGTATTKTDVSAAAVIPVTARLALMRVANNGTTVLSIGHPSDGLTAYPLIITIASGAILGAPFLTDAAQAFSYIFSSAGGPGGIVADLFGYTYER